MGDYWNKDSDTTLPARRSELGVERSNDHPLYPTVHQPQETQPASPGAVPLPEFLSLTYTLPYHLVEQINDLARETNRSPSELVADSIRLYLESLRAHREQSLLYGAGDVTFQQDVVQDVTPEHDSDHAESAREPFVDPTSVAAEEQDSADDARPMSYIERLRARGKSRESEATQDVAQDSSAEEVAGPESPEVIVPEIEVPEIEIPEPVASAAEQAEIVAEESTDVPEAIADEPADVSPAEPAAAATSPPEPPAPDVIEAVAVAPGVVESEPPVPAPEPSPDPEQPPVAESESDPPGPADIEIEATAEVESGTKQVKVTPAAETQESAPAAEPEAQNAAEAEPADETAAVPDDGMSAEDRALQEIADPAIDVRRRLQEVAAEPLDSRRLVRALQQIMREVDRKDFSPPEHSIKVADMAMELAKAKGFRGNRLHAIYVAALVHDIGKACIPDEVIKKPKPSSEEMALIRKYPEFGVDLLEPIPAMAPILGVIAAHQERWNGSGYPNRLSRTDIPVGAQIIALCDVYDVLITDRRYRPAYTDERARQIIQQNVGTLWNPEIGRALLTRVLTPEKKAAVGSRR
ncbi:MAG: HD domain-containing protein [Acidobacteria bacterium]|nr:HD domain-containing protein [Acidobacteriota bacterium]